jgi:hypothetical protein
VLERVSLQACLHVRPRGSTRRTVRFGNPEQPSEIQRREEDNT